MASPTGKRRPDIVFLAHQPAWRGSNGGMESATAIFEALSRDFVWHLFTNTQSARTRRWLTAGAGVTLFRYSDGGSRIVQRAQLFALTIRLMVFCLLHRPKAIHANDLQVVQAAVPVKLLLNIPLVYTVRGMKAQGEAYGAVWRLMARHADLVVALSDEMRAELIDAFDLPEEGVWTIRSLVDLNRFHPGTPRAECRNEYLLIVSAVVEKKGIYEFLREGLPAIVAKHPNLSLVIVGDFRPAEDAYAGKIDAMLQDFEHRECVSFVGVTDAVNTLMSNARAVLVPSEVEGMARCMIEALACGTPVISFNVCSAKEVLGQGGGIVVPQGDFAAFSAAVLSLLAHDPAVSKMRMAARRSAEVMFNRDPILQRWRALYRSFGAHSGSA